MPRERPDSERTRVPGWMTVLMGYAGMVNIDAICRDCAQRTQRLGYITLAGFALILLVLAGAVMKAF